MIDLGPGCGPGSDWYWPAFGIMAGIFLVGLFLWDMWDRRKKK